MFMEKALSGHHQYDATPAHFALCFNRLAGFSQVLARRSVRSITEAAGGPAALAALQLRCTGGGRAKARQASPRRLRSTAAIWLALTFRREDELIGVFAVRLASACGPTPQQLNFSGRGGEGFAPAVR
ncbi:hypothetical protein BRAS3809_3310013 [Bradyrhizobium sp. STM 3809]|nr:hypothetical protein BRAS3809_3310013 [Bradyrhizobium sp. STM 3809]